MGVCVCVPLLLWGESDISIPLWYPLYEVKIHQGMKDSGREGRRSGREARKEKEWSDGGTGMRGGAKEEGIFVEGERNIDALLVHTVLPLY
jgi:hypothetical protein